MPYEDEARHRYWLSDTGQRVYEDLSSLQYVWVELWRWGRYIHVRCYGCAISSNAQLKQLQLLSNAVPYQ